MVAYAPGDELLLTHIRAPQSEEKQQTHTHAHTHQKKKKESGHLPVPFSQDLSEELLIPYMSTTTLHGRDNQHQGSLLFSSLPFPSFFCCMAKHGVSDVLRDE